MFSNPLYKNSPIWLQETMISLREFGRRTLREGRRFRSMLEEITATQWLSGEKLCEYQNRQLSAIVQHAAINVPHYRRVFREHGLDPRSIVSSEDLKKLPLLTKQEIAADPTAFIAENWRGLKFKGSTSGTTGTPLTIYQDLNSIIREHAFVQRNLKWAGYEFGGRRAWLRGDMIVPGNQMQPPFWRADHLSNMLMLSAFHLCERSAGQYIQALQQFNPVVIQAFPSAISFLARYLASEGRYYQADALRAIVTSSETLSKNQADLIQQRMGCRVFDHYGSLERVVMISTCEYGRLHVNSDYGYMEELAGAGEQAEIVGTGFNNWLMPFLRYKTGDRIVMDDKKRSCACGRSFPLVRSVAGRVDDYVVTADGRKITRLTPIFWGVENIAEAQIVQERIGEVSIIVVPLGGFGEREKKSLLVNAAERLGEATKVTVDVVAQINRGPNGKLRTVLCKLEREQSDAAEGAGR